MQFESKEDSNRNSGLTGGSFDITPRNDTSLKWGENVKDNQGGSSRQRFYYLDWLRSMAIHLVIFVHTLEGVFDCLHIKDKDQVEQKKRIIISLVQIGIPLFFYISGTASSFYDCEKKGYLRYIWQKTIRLMVPFFVAVPIFLLPRLYWG